MLDVVVYSRRGCHLCEEMLEQLEPLCRGVAELTVRDIDTDPELQAAYTADVPVLLIDGHEVCRHFLDKEAVLSIIRAGGSREG